MKIKHPSLIAFLPQLNGHNGISRFNRNLIQALNPELETHIHSLNDPNNQEFHGYHRGKWKFYWAFFSTVIKRPDCILIGHLNFVPLTVISWLFRVKTIVILHGIEAWNIRRRNAIFLKFPSQYWAVSHYTKAKFEEASKVSHDQVFRIFNTLPPDWKMNNDMSHGPFFLSVCRLVKEEGYKGIDLTIKAIASLKSKIQTLGYTYTVVANGDDLQRHKDLANQSEIAHLINFKQGLSDNELSALYTQCNFFILPSTGEGFGIVFLEAMASKKACIGAKDCGAEDVIVDQQTGLLINQSEEEIKTALEFLLDNQEKTIAFGKAGHEKLINEFSFPKFSQRINELLDKCVA